MIKILLSGANGYMGRTVARLAAESGDAEVVAGVDVVTPKDAEFPFFRDAMEYTGDADVIVDFSIPDALDALIRCVKNRRIPLVICTTGHTPEQLDKLRALSKTVPVFRSGNMSLGINLVAELVNRAANALGSGFDVEILEKHHRRKVDAPSGTALMLADAISRDKKDKPAYVYDRSSRREPRPADEIGFSAIRGGTIVGEHSVIFAGTDEIIEIRHAAYSRDVFAVGALKAAKYMANVTEPGMYDMTDALSINNEQ